MKDTNPKTISVDTFYNKGSALYRINMFMEFKTPAEAHELNEAVSKAKEEMTQGRTPKLTFKLWTEEANP